MEKVSELITHASSEKEYQVALGLLEEAHIISQPYAFPHLRVHWAMFLIAFKHSDYKEFVGQIPRLILAIPGSLLGLAPKGNVGSTKMGIFEKKK